MFTTPVLVFGGPYSNLPATRAIRATADSLHIPPSHIVCTGDLVAYCAEPDAVVEEIRQWGIRVVMGNCEESLASRAPDCGCGFQNDTVCALLSDSWYRFSDHNISDRNRSWMSSLPREIRLQMSGHDILVVHGAPSSINRFIFASTPEQEKRQEMRDSDISIIVGGHSGIPFGQQVGDGFWLNAGVVGMPANDGSRSGWYMLLIPQRSGLKAEWRRLDYDWRKTQAAMGQAGLDSGYIQTLESGIWPSMDVLPSHERAQQGNRLELPALNIPTRVTNHSLQP